jgi:hypothetical protein
MIETDRDETTTVIPTATPGSAPVLVILPRNHATRYESLAEYFKAAPGCRLMVDRRVADRRRLPGVWESGDRRRGERRSGHLDKSPAVFVVC